MAKFSMDRSTNTPILLMAYNRPQTTQRQLSRIQELSPREIRVSIDGPRNPMDVKKCHDVLKVTETWASNSPHRVSIEVSQINLGLHTHFMRAFSRFFADHEFGIVLEDDIEFRNSFVDFVDKLNVSNEYRKYWSIQGHNPLPTASSSFKLGKEIRFERTNFHSVWGWASHSESIERMLKFISDSSNSKVLTTSIGHGASLFTADPFLQLAIRNVWLKKLLRAQSLTDGGWDNWWVASAWLCQKESLMPTASVTRESLSQHEGQSHLHTQSGVPWSESQLEEIPFEKEFRKHPGSKEIELLQTWGIRRTYSWAYAPRIITQYAKSCQKLGSSPQNAN
jgi:hypothetical protein